MTRFGHFISVNNQYYSSNVHYFYLQLILRY